MRMKEIPYSLSSGGSVDEAESTDGTAINIYLIAKVRAIPETDQPQVFKSKFYIVGEGWHYCTMPFKELMGIIGI